MKFNTTTGLLICCLALAIPYTGCCEGTNEDLTLFGITVIKQTSEAEKQYERGLAYYNGDDVEQNLDMAAKCFRKASNLGHAQSQYNLGMCFMDTRYKAHSETSAANCFRKAFEQGVEEALYPLGICHYNLEHYPEAYAWGLFAEAKGDPRLKKMFDTMFSEEEIADGKARYVQLKQEAEQAAATPE